MMRYGSKNYVRAENLSNLKDGLSMKKGFIPATKIDKHLRI